MIEIREVGTDQEWQEYIKIRCVVFIQEQDVPEEDEIDVYEKESTHFVATFNGQPAGTGRFRFKGCLIKFERIATLKEFRGKGVASAIMEFMGKRAKIKHSDYLPTMHAQVDVVSFYSERGWTSIGKIFEESGINHQLMVFLPKNSSHLKCLKDPDTPQAIKEFLLKFQK